MAEVDICNQALLSVGADQILSLDAVSKEGVLCNGLYSLLRDEELAKHPWNFAIKRALIPANATVPVYTYEFTLPLPPDYLRLLEVESTGINPSLGNIGTLDFGSWVVEGKFILAFESPLNIKYISRETDTLQFSTMFTSCIVARLGAELAIPLRNDAKLAERFAEKYERLTAAARFSDATEDAVTRLDADDWLLSRGDFNLSQVPKKIVP